MTPPGIPSHRPALRKTKIIATIGPSSDDPVVLRALMDAGMNVARLNFSHGSHDEHAARVRRIREVAAAAGANVAIMLDTRGFEIRTGRVIGGAVELTEGQTFTLHAEAREGDSQGVSISYPELPRYVPAGTRVLIDDGRISMEVQQALPDALVCRVLNSATLKDRKGLSVPGVDLPVRSLTEQDKRDLLFAVEQGLDYIAASFVNDASDVIEIRDFLRAHGGDMPIIAKIEKRKAVDNLVAILVEADGAMVARGDLGVEVPVEEVPLMQKKIIRTTVMNGKPVITATQMLDSMERNPRPTRAETTDVANAIFDGTSAVMLSGETAAGRYPVESVRTMHRLALQAEAALNEYGYLQKINTSPSHRVTEAVSQAAITTANHLDAAAILTLTQSGHTSRSISKYRPRCPIFAITSNPTVVRRLAMNWGVTPLLCEDNSDDAARIEHALTHTRALGYVQKGDRVVVTAGISNQPGTTSSIRVISVDS